MLDGRRPLQSQQYVNNLAGQGCLWRVHITCFQNVLSESSFVATLAMLEQGLHTGNDTLLRGLDT